ncbi:MAG: hypothetical protein HC775_18675 [Hyellaceae cyanobacterium CSU_1_1]|nr:hypothetical protein [Hyellaceae cyanobacterium CSU_1_1]
MMMSKPKYEIGDRIEGTNLIVRGKMMLANGSERYFLQIDKSDNSLVLNDDDILIKSDDQLISKQ